MVIHDASTKRTAGMDLKVAETPASALRRLDVGRFKGAAFAGECIPLLEEVLNTLPPQRKLFVELKSGKEIVPLLHHVLTKRHESTPIVIVGFDVKILVRIKACMPATPTYWLRRTIQDRWSKTWLPYGTKLIQVAREKGLDGLGVHYAGVTQRFVEAVKAAGLKLYVWTVNDPEEAYRLAAFHVDGIITDRPGWIREQLRA